MTRKVFVWLHRWIGLSVAGFLVIIGLTGSVLPFWEEINHWLTPDLYPGPQQGARMDIAALARRAESIVPQARAVSVNLAYPGSASILMLPREGAAQLDFEFLHLDPIDGHERGRVTWHYLPRRQSDIMPFIYGVHMYLAAPGVGDWILGVVALLWTVDCFIAFYLTLPAGGDRTRKSFLARWKPSWMVKLKSSFYRLNFDLHRAGGLWLWTFLLIFAWSSVYFTMPTVYTGVTNCLFGYVDTNPTPVTPSANDVAPMSWEAALATGERLMSAKAQERSIVIDRPIALDYLAESGVYEYRAHSSRDIGVRSGATTVLFDARSGELRAFKSPSGEQTGNTITSWLVALHTADVFGLPYRIFICLLGLIIVMLSATGVYIWWKKRRARILHGRHSEPREPLIAKIANFTSQFLEG